MLRPRLFLGVSTLFSLALLAGSPAGAGAASRLARIDALFGADAASDAAVLVANLNGGVQIYPASLHAKNPRAFGLITDGAPRPSGLWVDGRKNLYVVNNNSVNGSFVSVYRHGAFHPFRSITQGLYAPGHVAVGRDGAVYVTDYQSGFNVIRVCAPGSNKLARNINVLVKSRGNGIGGLAFDLHGNLLVGEFSIETQKGQVYRVDPHSGAVNSLNLQDVGGAAIAIDGSENLYVGDIGGAVQVYPPGSKTPSRSMPAGGYIFGMTATPNGTVYAVSYYSGMFEYAPGATGPTNTFQDQSAMDAALTTMR